MTCIPAFAAPTFAVTEMLPRRPRCVGGYVQTVTLPPCRTMDEIVKAVFAAEVKGRFLPPLAPRSAA